MSIKPFENIGNFTTFPNTIIDYVVPYCKTTTWKLLTVIIRKTIGWHKAVDMLSLSQLVSLTGMTKPTVIASIKDAIKSKYIIRNPKGNSFVYGINRDYILPASKNPLPLNGKNPLPVGSKTPLHTEERVKNIKKEELKDSVHPDPFKEIYPQMLKAWKEIFPDKPQPRYKTSKYQDKVRTRIKDKHFVDNWENAMVAASQSITLVEESWFDFEFFVYDDLHYQKCINHFMKWKDDQRQKTKNQSFRQL